MALKHLNNYIRFDFKAFIQGKRFKLKEVSEWKDFDTKEVLGTKASVSIIDDSVYKTKDGEEVGANDMETLIVKVRKPLDTFKNWKRRDEVAFYKVEKVSVYGEYQNQLSIIGDVINVSNPDADYIEKN